MLGVEVKNILRIELISENYKYLGGNVHPVQQKEFRVYGDVAGVDAWQAGIDFRWLMSTSS
jgi:hypothetical protein